MDRYVLPEFGQAHLADIRRADLQVFFNRLGKSLGPSSLAKVRIVLSGVFRLAVADELLAANPATFVRLPQPPPPRKTALTFAELGALVEAAGPLARPFVLLAGCCGLRLGEAVGVTRHALSRAGVLTVSQQVQQHKGGCVVKDTLKTGHSRREVPLPAGLLDALLSCGQVSGVWVCSDSLGGYIRPKNVARELRRACLEAGVPIVSPHELRHTFISLMDNELEAPRTVVMALAGHSPQTTTDGYSHVRVEQKLRWMERYWARTADAGKGALEGPAQSSASIS